MSEKGIHVSFEPILDGKYRGSLSLVSLTEIQDDPEALLLRAAEVYRSRITKMQQIVIEVKERRSKREKVSAALVWNLGDEIFGLTEDLAGLSLELDGLYNHLVRDLDANRKWIEKVIILRRYLPQRHRILESLTWGYFEKSTRRKAEALTSESVQEE